MGEEELKVSAAAQASLEGEASPVSPAAAVSGNQMVPVVDDDHQNGSADAEEEAGNDQKDGSSPSKKSASPVSETENEAAVAEKTTEKTPLNPVRRDAALARVQADKRNALISAWEENEKAKIDKKTYKRLSAIESWENTKKAVVEVQLKEFEEQLQRKRAEYGEKVQNKLAEIHKEAEEKKAVVEANKGEEYVKIEETANRYRTTGNTPRKFFSCLGC